MKSIRKMIEEHSLELTETVYQFIADECLDWPLLMGDYMEIYPCELAAKEYGILKSARECEEQAKREDEEYQSMIKEDIAIAELVGKGEKFKGTERFITPERQLSLQECKLELRNHRKALKSRIKEKEQRIRQSVAKQQGCDWHRLQCLRYKNTVCVTSMGELANRIPVLAGVGCPQQLPVFVSNIDRLERALDHHRRIGIVGGPCLFGMDEVRIHLILENSQEYVYDCCCGRRGYGEKDDGLTLYQFTRKHGAQVKNIRIENRKAGITRQEYDSLRYVFAFGVQIQAKCVIPIPDMSYLKYMEADIGGLNPELQEEVMRRFREVCYEITDMYLQCIRQLALEYPALEYKVLHERDEDMLRQFYEKRSPFVEKSSYMRKLTDVDGRKDAVIDYVTMLALPYYFYDADCILQLDSVDETDSGRKCLKIHKGYFDYTQILLPEYISEDGEHTIYNAPLEYKAYV